MIYHEVVKFK